ncbi:MAG: hydroxymethylglutaryl-CoA lyase [Gammaproteobacteria bacterium]|nr:hydroxymethylglutaryl-CoA lyase [Gammaproteobacteria bacterium]
MTLPHRVKIVEVGPRDGLQNEVTAIDTATKVEFINQLSATGLSVIEATSMVNPKWVPQLADAEAVFSQIKRHAGVSYPVLIPNLQGLERAIAVGADHVAVFTAASETFNQKNINCSIDESLQRFEPVMALAKANNIQVRGYISCVLGCPYEGKINPEKVANVATRLHTLGCAEISLGDTIGVGTPLQAQDILRRVSKHVPMHELAVHFHDTRGQALANIYACLQLGIATIDTSVAGLGGCPYANGATGNVATEDVIYMLHGMGIETGVDLAALIKAGHFICEKLGRPINSKLGRIGLPS